MTFRNKNFTKRDYECTNVVLAIADHEPMNGMEWEPISREQFETAINLMKLYVLEAEWGDEWRFDDFACTDLMDAVAKLNEMNRICPNINYRIGRYDRTKTIEPVEG